MKKRSTVQAALLALCWSWIVIANSFSFAQDLSQSFGIGLIGGPIKMIGGPIDRSTIDQWAGMQLGYNFDQSLAFNASFGYGWVYPKAIDGSQFEPTGDFKTILIPINLNLVYNLIPQSRFRPCISLGTGFTFWDIRKLGKDFSIFSRGKSLSGSQINATLIGGFGFEYLLSQRSVLSMILHYHRLLKGDEDTIGFGDDGNDGIAELRLGVAYFFKSSRDRDKDGIEDKLDVDPSRPEDVDGFQDNDGAPDLDNDQDGIPDLRDKAPNDPEDMDGFQDKDGIPDLDNDGDKIPDEDDKCAMIPEDYDGFEDHDGCPEFDNDKDSIPDSLDQCPNWPEDFNGYMDEDGCPDTKPEPKPEVETEPEPIEKGKNIVLKGVNFESASARLTVESFAVLDEIAKTLNNNPNIEIEIRGYTDNIGESNANLLLSERRAIAVKKYLVDHGISPTRLQAVGYGASDPIASNATKEGRAANRRIEFVRIK